MMVWFSRDILDKLGEPYINKNNKGKDIYKKFKRSKGKIYFIIQFGKAFLKCNFKKLFNNE